MIVKTIVNSLLKGNLYSFIEYVLTKGNYVYKQICAAMELKVGRASSSSAGILITSCALRQVPTRQLFYVSGMCEILHRGKNILL